MLKHEYIHTYTQRERERDKSNINNNKNKHKNIKKKKIAITITQVILFINIYNGLIINQNYRFCFLIYCISILCSIQFIIVWNVQH